MTNTTEVVKQILVRIKAEPTLDLPDTADLVDDLRLDSLEMLQLMLEIEASLAIQIDFDKLEFTYLRSIRQLADFLDTMPARPAP